MDHLEGILFIDYLSKLKKTMILKKLSKNKFYSDSCLINGKKDYFYGHTTVCCKHSKISVSKWLSDICCIYSASSKIS